MELTKEAIEGYAYQESITGEATEAYQNRRLEEIGITHWHDMKRAKVQDLIKKIEMDPDAFKAIIDEKATAIAAAIAP